MHRALFPAIALSLLALSGCGTEEVDQEAQVRPADTWIITQARGDGRVTVRLPNGWGNPIGYERLDGVKIAVSEGAVRRSGPCELFLSVKVVSSRSGAYPDRLGGWKVSAMEHQREYAQRTAHRGALTVIVAAFSRARLTEPASQERVCQDRDTQRLPSLVDEIITGMR